MLERSAYYLYYVLYCLSTCPPPSCHVCPPFIQLSCHVRYICQCTLITSRSCHVCLSCDQSFVLSCTFTLKSSRGGRGGGGAHPSVTYLTRPPVFSPKLYALRSCYLCFLTFICTVPAELYEPSFQFFCIRIIMALVYAVISLPSPCPSSASPFLSKFLLSRVFSQLSRVLPRPNPFSAKSFLRRALPWPSFFFYVKSFLSKVILSHILPEPFLVDPHPSLSSAIC